MLTKPNIPTEYLRIGTCSWKYDSWKGLVYDPDKKYRPEDYLADYSQYLPTGTTLYLFLPEKINIIAQEK